MANAGHRSRAIPRERREGGGSVLRPEDIVYIEYRLRKAGEALRAAELIASEGPHGEAVSKLYYACYYCVIALLHTEGLVSSKHQSAIAFFDTHWINNGRLPRELGSFFHRMFQRRQKGDYAAFVAFERADVEAWLSHSSVPSSRRSLSGCGRMYPG